MTRTIISPSDLSQRTREILDRVQEGEPAVVARGGEERSESSSSMFSTTDSCAPLLFASLKRASMIPAIFKMPGWITALPAFWEAPYATVATSDELAWTTLAEVSETLSLFLVSRPAIGRCQLLEAERMEVDVTEFDSVPVKVVHCSKRWPRMAIGRGARE